MDLAVCLSESTYWLLACSILDLYHGFDSLSHRKYLLVASS